MHQAWSASHVATKPASTATRALASERAGLDSRSTGELCPLSSEAKESGPKSKRLTPEVNDATTAFDPSSVDEAHC